MNCSTFLNHNTWGVHVNFEGHFASPTTSLQQREWQCRGIIVWYAGVRVVAHLYAGYVLEFLEQVRANDAWQSNDFLIGAPTHQLSSETVDEQLMAFRLWKAKANLHQTRQRIFLIFECIQKVTGVHCHPR